MKTTPVNAIPYAEDSDAPDYPTQGKALADLLDTLKWGSRNLKPTAGAKTGSEGVILGTSYSDLPMAGGTLEITPAVTSTLLVVATFCFFTPSALKNYIGFSGSLKLDSAAEQTALAEYQGPSELNKLKMATQVYALSLTAGAHTIKMRARRQAGVAEEEVTTIASNTRMLYLLVAS